MQSFKLIIIEHSNVLPGVPMKLPIYDHSRGENIPKRLPNGFKLFIGHFFVEKTILWLELFKKENQNWGTGYDQ